jgi:hypothetical protein
MGAYPDTGGTIDQSIPTTVQLVPLLMEPDLLPQVQDAAAAHGASVVAWVRHALRQVTGADFPPNWHEEAARGRNDSRHYGKRFMLRLDTSTRARLEDLVHHFDRSHAEIIR